jgi:subtilisin family serine protease
VQLREDTAARVTESIARGPRRGVTEAGARTFGIGPLDSVLSDLKVTDIQRLHPPTPVTSRSMTQAAPMASTFRLTFSSATAVEKAVDRLEGVDGVEFAEPNRYRETYAIPNDPNFAAQWGLTKINAPAAWDRTTGSPNITVAILDTGIDLDHPELAPLLVQGTDMVDLGPNPTPPAGFRFEGDFQGRDNIPQDEVGHGTHVAGTVACLSNNGVGVAGVTWSCRLMPVKVLTRIVNVNNANDVRGTGSAADIAAGIRWAVDNGARVLNLSLGGTTDTQVERDAIAYAVAQGAVVVAAMGNAFQQGNPTSFPAAYPDVVAVGAINTADARAPFSQTGPHIDVAAPGVGVLSTVWDNGFTNMSGTSMASPHVAGLAALILSCNGNLTAAQVADIIRQTARPLRDNPADPVPNNNYGFGCIDAEAAINRACPRRSVPILSCPQPSLVVRCPTLTVQACPRPSVTVQCPTLQISTCPRPSLITLCPTVPVSACVQPSVPVATCPRPSVTIRCPSGFVCGVNPGRPPAGGGQRDTGEGAGGPAGQGESGWPEDDPYGGDYGGEGGGAGGY